MTGAFFVQLPPRGQVRVGGPDSFAFLQAIISNDLRLLESQAAVYSCFLTPQGKFLHDFFVLRDGDGLILECEGGGRSDNLLRKIKPFKLRSKVELAVETDAPIYAVLKAFPPSGGRLDGGDSPPLPNSGMSAQPSHPPIQPSPRKWGEGFLDPRHPDLGLRTFSKPADLEERSFATWDETRIRLGIPDGSRDMAVEKDTLLECNIDRAQGLSHTKGCYIGQEITARMNLRGLVKKHLYPVTVHGVAPVPFTDITIDGQLVGQMRSASNGIGIALLKDDALPLLTQADSPLSLFRGIPS